MTALAPILIPAAGVLLGAFVGGGATLWGQVLTSRSTRRREIEARQDAFTVKVYEIERDALIMLQELLGDLLRMFLKRSALTSESERADLDEAFIHCYVKIMAFGNRVGDRPAAIAIVDFAVKCSKASLNPPAASAQEVHDSHSLAQACAGMALTRNPYSDVEPTPPHSPVS